MGNPKQPPLGKGLFWQSTRRAPAKGRRGWKTGSLPSPQTYVVSPTLGFGSGTGADCRYSKPPPPPACASMGLSKHRVCVELLCLGFFLKQISTFVWTVNRSVWSLVVPTFCPAIVWAKVLPTEGGVGDMNKGTPMAIILAGVHPGVRPGPVFVCDPPPPPPPRVLRDSGVGAMLPTAPKFFGACFPFIKPSVF